MLCSLFENNKRHRFHVHIFSFDISEKNKNCIKAFAERYGNTVSFYSFDDKGIKYPNIGSGHISKESYIRLFAPNYLPDDIERILYLDVDLLVLDDIQELYSIPMESAVIAGIMDYPEKDRYERLGIPSEYGYFNAGVMMFNIKLWKEAGLTHAAKNILNNTGIELKHHDQDVLNMLCHEKWKRISFRWNIMDVFFYDINQYEEKYRNEIRKEITHPCIVHFTGSIKPWNAWIPNPYYKYYYLYLAKTPWKGYRPSIKSQWNAYRFPRNVLTVLKLDRILVSLKMKIKKLVK